MSTGMTIFVSVLVIVNVLACVWLIWWTARVRPGEEAEGATKSHVWDEDLQEYNNPMPRWWLNLFFITIVFSLGYFVLYPGLGSFAGTLDWSSEGQHDDRLAEVDSQRQAHFARFEGREIADLAADPEAAAAAGRLFADNCAGCHGPTAQGAIGFPNLADDDWLYGNAAPAVLQSITAGRNGVMPPFNAALDTAAVENLVALVGNWQDPTLRADRLQAARDKFAVTCGACHGADGTGNPALGAPNLTDDIWLYGGKPEQIRQSILFGRQGRMPAHADLLSDIEIRLLAAYVLRISGSAQ